MAPQELQGFNSSYNLPVTEGSTETAASDLAEPAEKYATLVFATWALSTVLIFTQRILLREDPFSFQVLGKDISLNNPGLLSKKQVQKIDGILFTVNYSLLSFLMALQFIPGKVNT